MALLELFQTIAIVAVLFIAFYSMGGRGVPQSIAMPLAASALLALFPFHAKSIVQGAFHDFGPVAVLFTTVAIPAHMVERSQAFKWLGAWLGSRIGDLSLRSRKYALPVLVFSLLIATFVGAALLHNITSIMVMVPITITICSQYGIPTRWLLSAELIASNLGGFSSSWGDTPNIIERTVWLLTNRDFFVEILPLNGVVLLLLGVVVVLLTRRVIQREIPNFDMALATEQQRWQLVHTRVDRRLLFAGIATLALFIGLQTYNRELELAAASGVILLAVLLERAEDRLTTLQALDLELYMVLGSIFVLARAVDESMLGKRLADFMRNAKGAPFAVAMSAYVGTALTEAASWASATAGPVHAVNASHAAAWSLGAGICAGSSSILTAASAGLILWSQSKRFPGHEITFGRYLKFGIPASLAMLTFYIVYFTFVW